MTGKVVPFPTPAPPPQLRKLSRRRHAPIVVDGCEDRVDLLRLVRARKQELEILELEHRAAIIEAAETDRRDAEAAGATVTRASVTCSRGGPPATVQWIDQFSDLNPGAAEVLRAQLGDGFGDLFEWSVSVKVRPGTTLDRLRLALGEQGFTILAQFLALEETLTARKGFHERRRTLAGTLTPEAEALLDEVERQARTSPHLKL